MSDFDEMDPEAIRYYLHSLSQKDVFDWLKDNQPEEPKYSEREDLEADLLRRGEPLVNLGLAMFGTTPQTAITIFHEGDVAVKKALLRDFPFNVFSVIEDYEPLIRTLVEGSEGDHVLAYAENHRIADDHLEQILERRGLFSVVSDDLWRDLLGTVANQPRLSKDFYSFAPDWYGAGKHYALIGLVWRLFESLPVNKENAWLLDSVCTQVLPHAPSDMDVEQVIDRWRPDSSQQDTDRATTEAYANCRETLARLFSEGSVEFAELANSDDLALRVAYYRRFWPTTAEEVRTFYERDVHKFIEAATSNEKLYQVHELREELRRCCHDAAGRHHHSQVHASFFSRKEDDYREEHPEWFESEGIRSTVRADPMKELRNDVQLAHQKLDELKSSTQRTSNSGIPWLWLVAGIIIGLLLRS